MGLLNAEFPLKVSDIAVTTERQRVVDFLVPYYEQTKLGIITVRVTSQSRLFKFIEVLSPEVWIGIFSTIFVTALLIFLVEKYSPLSGKKALLKGVDGPPPRVFDLKESFYFAISSITPEGNGHQVRSSRVYFPA